MMAGFLALATTICFIAGHPGPAEHFTDLANHLNSQGYDAHVYTFTDVAYHKFQERHLEVDQQFVVEGLTSEEEEQLAKTIAKISAKAQCVITDVGHPFNIKIQKALHAYPIKQIAYYDNPASIIPGGNSNIAFETMQAAGWALFANAILAESTTPIYKEPGNPIDFSNIKRIGLGYSPTVNLATIISKRRIHEQLAMRSDFFTKNNIEDKGQKIVIYFGGNNHVYFEQALPAFLSLCAEAAPHIDLSQVIFVLQQHPRAKELNLDSKQVEAWSKTHKSLKNMPTIFISNFSTDNAQVFGDAAFYYQTSMTAQFVLEGLPTFQVGHDDNDDILVKAGCVESLTNVQDFINAIKTINAGKLEEPLKDVVFNAIGINANWQEILENAIEESCN